MHTSPAVEELRAQTPGCARGIHLDNAGAGLMARSTVQAMIAHLELEAEIGGYAAQAAAREGIERTYAGLAELLGGAPGEIALFDGASRAWSAAFASVPLGPGDVIVTGRSEYAANMLGYLRRSRETGAEVVVAPDDERGRTDPAALAEIVDERTRLIGVTHVPASSGLVNPVAEIGRIAREAGVPYLVDATQSVGHLPIDVAAVDCDLLVGTGRKFLRGPRGTGFLWVHPEAVERFEPVAAELTSACWHHECGLVWAEGARRYETFEKGYAGVLGLADAVDRSLALGAEPIAHRVTALARALRERLVTLDGVTTHDGPGPCAIVTADVDGVAAGDLARDLAAADVTVGTVVPDHQRFDRRGEHRLLRLSPHYYNTVEELDRVTERIDDVTLARRRTAGSPSD